ncbi:phosphoribosylaminoimidazolesuccinocarboxamide synthase [Gammaproteobacteria bacterium]|nr:phosphoribosylaminoimidazolesuccinocarboxamide synthase [Gammaproteobacteria bacterium]
MPMSAITIEKYSSYIQNALQNCITETNFDIGTKYKGKVRDNYDLSDKLLLVSTDRQSAFDRLLASVPFKGQVLNLISSWWFEKTKHIISNHLIDVPDPNITIAKKCSVFPVEFVVRSYLTGSTNTSIWTHYKNGLRNFSGVQLRPDLKKNHKLDELILTPTTKDKHDKPISKTEIVKSKLMTKKDFEIAYNAALKLFKFGSNIAARNGLILVDTKYEFGKDENGNILLVDEIHTPDSSRYWLADTYEDRIANNMEPENIDKEFLRLWFVDNCDPYLDENLPKAPDELIMQLSFNYIKLYEMITNEKFYFPIQVSDIKKRMLENITSWL